jgi:hypothetical protein
MINYPNSSAPRDSDIQMHIYKYLHANNCVLQREGYGLPLIIFFEANGMCLSQCCVKYDIEKG